MNFEGPDANFWIVGGTICCFGTLHMIIDNSWNSRLFFLKFACVFKGFWG